MGFGKARISFIGLMVAAVAWGEPGAHQGRTSPQKPVSLQRTSPQVPPPPFDADRVQRVTEELLYKWRSSSPSNWIELQSTAGSVMVNPTVPGKLPKFNRDRVGLAVEGLAAQIAARKPRSWAELSGIINQFTNVIPAPVLENIIAFRIMQRQNADNQDAERSKNEAERVSQADKLKPDPDNNFPAERSERLNPETRAALDRGAIETAGKFAALGNQSPPPGTPPPPTPPRSSAEQRYPNLINFFRKSMDVPMALESAALKPTTPKTVPSSDLSTLTAPPVPPSAPDAATASEATAAANALPKEPLDASSLLSSLIQKLPPPPPQGPGAPGPTFEGVLKPLKSAVAEETLPETPESEVQDPREVGVRNEKDLPYKGGLAGGRPTLGVDEDTEGDVEDAVWDWLARLLAGAMDLPVEVDAAAAEETSSLGRPVDPDSWERFASLVERPLGVSHPRRMVASLAQASGFRPETGGWLYRLSLLTAWLSTVGFLSYLYIRSRFGG